MEIDKEIFEYVSACAHSAKKASELLAISSIDARNKAILCMAAALRDNEHEILSANKVDIEAARAQNTKESLIDRLALSKARIDDMAKGLEALVSLVDPLGVVQEERILESGINLKRISVPLGVVAVVYEARPNVGADAAGICLKAGNAVILRGGSLAANSNKAIASVLHDAAFNAGLPKGCIEYIATTQRCATDALMSMHGVVDVLIPRGGAGLINHCVEHSRVPVIETGTGNCHIYVHESANLEMALRIVVNAKCRRYGVCNAAETLLVDSSIANDFLPLAFEAMAQKDILLHCDELSLEYAQAFKKDKVYSSA